MKYIEEELKSLKASIVNTPDSKQDLEAFAKANGGVSDYILMQMAIQFGYKLALENVKENLEKDGNNT